MTGRIFHIVQLLAFMQLAAASTALSGTYDTCIKKRHSKKYWCGRGSHLFQEYYQQETRCGNLNSTLHFLGDSFMLEVWDAYSCMCKDVATTLHEARGNKITAESALSSLLPAVKPGDIIIMNFGLWFNHASLSTSYTKQLQKVKHILARTLNDKPWLQVVWIRTLAQHFCTKGGVFHKVQASKKDQLAKRCCSIKHPSIRRQQIVNEHLLYPLRKAIVVYDAFKLTTGWFNQHPGRGDCTHLCSDIRDRNKT